MTTTQKAETREERETRIREDFVRHVATLKILEQRDNGMQIANLVWRRPDSGNYAVHYVVYGAMLFVCGDLGEAVYQWSSFVSVEWLAKLDLSYFAGKCTASANGRGYKEWDSDLARERFLEDVARFRQEGDVIDDGEVQSALIAIDECGPSAGPWEAWCRTDAHTIYGDDWWESAPGIGERIDWQCQAHLLGLKLAVAQLRESGVLSA